MFYIDCLPAVEQHQSSSQKMASNRAGSSRICAWNASMNACSPRISPALHPVVLTWTARHTRHKSTCVSLQILSQIDWKHRYYSRNIGCCLSANIANVSEPVPTSSTRFQAVRQSMWPFGGAVLVTLGLLPSVVHWLRHGQAGTLWQAAVHYSLIDGGFVAGALLFLYIATKYGESRSKVRPAPYPGAWVDHDGHQRSPRGFTPGYLGFAAVVSLIIPAAVLLFSSGTSRPLAFATLGPYLVVFIPQVLLEARYLNRSFMTPALPILFMFYRLWQMIRSLQLVTQHHKLETQGGAMIPGQHWLTTYLLSLLIFWIFDTGCTVLWLPWMYDWQLQDPKHLRDLAKIHEQDMLQAAKQRRPAGPDASAATDMTTAAPGGTSHGMTTRSKARTPTKHRVVNSGEIDSYGYGM